MKFTLLSIFLSVCSARAVAQDLFLEGRRVSYQSPAGVSELCVVPRKLGGLLAKQSGFDQDDQAMENTLCGIDMYQGAAGVCPKLNSTNPGVLISFLPEGMTKQAFETQHCRDDDPKQDNFAKYKQSISCSYTPSGLAYYQLSRVLGGAGRVPVNVVRTMDRQEHLRLTQRALSLLGNSQAAIAQTWKQFLSAHQARPLSRDLFSADGQLYGFLAENPDNEENYTEVSGVGPYDTRYQRFVQQAPFRRVSSAATVETLAGSREPRRLLPLVVQMKDVSDMVLLDTLLTQGDRIGNIHFKFRWYHLENGDLVKTKSKAKRPGKGKVANYKEAVEAVVPERELTEMRAKDAFLVKEMLLKDNDCGVDVGKRDNMMQKVNAVGKLRHLSGQTYASFIRLAEFIRVNPQAAREYFTKDLLFTPADYESSEKSFLKNMARIRTTLQANCRSGLLKLDLDVERYLPGAKVAPVSCDVSL